MKLLLFSDLHCDATAAKWLVDRAAEVDVVVGAGDFATGRCGIQLTIDILRNIDQPAIVVPGNNESCDELREACRGWSTACVLHGVGARINEVDFYGLGGGIRVTPFGSWSYDFTEEQAEELLADWPYGGVIVSHSPPHGAVDTSQERNLGSVALRTAIEDKSPRLVVCGHIHESARRSETIGTTAIVNAGPHGILWTLAE